MKKKLFLNKQTITNLNNSQQQKIKGGGETCVHFPCSVPNCPDPTVNDPECFPQTLAGPGCDTILDPETNCGLPTGAC